MTMANAIALFKKYIDALDEVYKLESTTSDLESNAALTRAGAVANEILIPKYQLQGLADYDRNNGYVRGSIVLDYETVKYNFDRGRSFLVDAMDNEETAGLAFGSLAAEFLRTQVIPEMDAFRYASYAAKAFLSRGLKTIGVLEALVRIPILMTSCAGMLDFDDDNKFSLNLIPSTPTYKILQRSGCSKAINLCTTGAHAFRTNTIDELC